MTERKPPLIPSIWQMKCPKCRKGHMFVNKRIFPLREMMLMPEKCTVCGQKMELEVGFYYGTGYVSYALTVGILAILFILYALIFGLSYKDNSIFYALGSSVAIVLLMQPWLMRISRVLYLYGFVKYGQGQIMVSEETE